MAISNLYPFLKLDALSGFVALFIGFFTLITIIYSLDSMKASKHLARYYLNIMLTAISALAVVLANNLLVLLVFWGFLGLTLFLLINMGEKEASAVAKKTFIIVGGSDALMILGIGIIYYLTGTFQMDKISLSFGGSSATIKVVAYLCLAIACFAKAGAMPFHSWIPDCAESAPTSVVAFLPASLDKLLGIYLLTRISLNLFVMNQLMNNFLMIVGAVTIIAAVMMALVQHNLKRLLGYHAVSQVGYMVLGIGTGIPVGIAGGVFHMLNHAIYKSCLFLTGGNVESKAKTAELNKLGGLAKFMPITYVSCLIASLSISGMPPFNGFVSKWMIYQGLISKIGVAGSGLRATVVVCLTAAMFGSALTLASFMKLIHATFLGQQSKEHDTHEKISEVSWPMWLPCAVLAVICVLFGVFANQIPLKYFIFPAVGRVDFIGTWSAGVSILLVIIGLAAGVLLFRLKALKTNTREDSAFVGGEEMDLEESRVSGTEFYNTVKEISFLGGIYQRAEKGFFDIYQQGKNFVFALGRFFQYLHNGVLPTYLVWALLGMIVLFFALFKV